MSSGNVEPTADADTVYARIGGAEGVRRLVERFYELMDSLPQAQGVRRMHPQALDRSADSLFKFLSGWFGGPPLYMRERGHPRLRMRHAPFAIGTSERDAWMQCMRQALDEQVADKQLRAAVHGAFSAMADHMINRAPGEASTAA